MCSSNSTTEHPPRRQGGVTQCITGIALCIMLKFSSFGKTKRTETPSSPRQVHTQTNYCSKTNTMFSRSVKLTASPISPTISRRRGLWLASTRSHLAMKCPCANSVDSSFAIVPAGGFALVPALYTHGMRWFRQHHRLSHYCTAVSGLLPQHIIP